MDPLCVIHVPEVADLAFLVDVTGSMAKYIDGIRESIQNIIRASAVKISRLRIAFVGYRDVRESRNFEIQDFTDSVLIFKQFVGDIRAERGGNDAAEDVLGGLEQTLLLDWNPEAGSKVVFHIGDAPCHGRMCHDLDVTEDAYLRGDPLGRNITELFQGFKDNFLTYVFGRVNDETDKMLNYFTADYGEIRQFNMSSGRPTELIEDAVVQALFSSVQLAQKRLEHC